MSRQLPFYVSLPVILSCGVAGYMAGSAHPDSAITGEVRSRPQVEISHGPTATPTLAKPAGHDQEQVLSAWVPPMDALPVVPPSAAEAKPPAPALGGVDPERKYAVEVVSPVPVTRALTERPRTALAVRATTKPRRHQRVTQKPAIMPATISPGLNGIPLIGPMLSQFK
jgi:hypothetical protein